MLHQVAHLATHLWHFSPGFAIGFFAGFYLWEPENKLGCFQPQSSLPGVFKLPKLSHACSNAFGWDMFGTVGVWHPLIGAVALALLGGLIGLVAVQITAALKAWPGR